MAYVGVHDVHGVSGGRNHERWEEKLLETVTVKEEAAPAPALPCHRLLPFYPIIIATISKVRRPTDRALPYVRFVSWEREELCIWINHGGMQYFRKCAAGWPLT